MEFCPGGHNFTGHNFALHIELKQAATICFVDIGEIVDHHCF